MPDAIHGTLLTCDNPPIKTFIESLNESLPQESQFIISHSAAPVPYTLDGFVAGEDAVTKRISSSNMTN